MKIKLFIASRSFLIVKVIFSITFIVISVLDLYSKEAITGVMAYMFFLNIGIFVGYSISFYSIKFLTKHQNNGCR